MTVPWDLIINAGGLSQRMGMPKALLPTPPKGRPLYLAIIDRLRQVAPQTIVIVANDEQLRCTAPPDADIHWLHDQGERIGPLGGIATALATIDGWGFCVACDMPLLNPQLLHYMLSIAAETDASGVDCWDAVVPIVDGYPEPMHALYHARCNRAVAQSIAQHERRATAFLNRVRVHYIAEEQLRRIDPQLHSFSNINTPEEWQAIQAYLAA